MEKVTLDDLLEYGLTLTPLSVEGRKIVFLFLKTKEMKEDMIIFLLRHKEATGQEIMNELGRLIEENKKTTE